MIYNVDGVVTGAVTSVQSVSGAISGVVDVTGEITASGTTDYPEYDGSYEITPSEDTQTLGTAYHVPIADIIVNPIPSNYGLITWNGSTLTVS